MRTVLCRDGTAELHERATSTMRGMTGRLDRWRVGASLGRARRNGAITGRRVIPDNVAQRLIRLRDRISDDPRPPNWLRGPSDR
jgi:hypothetical protein